MPSVTQAGYKLWALWITAFAVAFGFTAWAAYDDLHGHLSLAVLTPAVSGFVWLGNYYFRWAPQAIPIIAPVAGVLLMLTTFFVSWQAFLFAAAISAFIAGEVFLLHDVFFVTWILFGIGVCGCIVAYQFKRHYVDTGVFIQDEELVSGGEWWCIIGITIFAAVFRYYAINQVTNYLEGELSPYAAAASSLSGIAFANKGANGPWAPLGLLYYIPIYITTSLFGTTITALRCSSAVVGVLTVPLLYLFVRKIAGRATAVWAALLFALDSLHIGWARTDVHPHGVTTWPTLLLCLVLVHCVRKPSTFWYIFLALCMGLTWHQYPSGQAAVCIPFVALGLYWIFSIFGPKIKPSIKISIIPWVLAGAALWYLGLPLSYYLADGHWNWSNPFTLTSQRTSWGNTDDNMGFVEGALFVVRTAVEHTSDVLQGIFYKVPYLFHQDFVPQVPDLTVRTVPWLIVPLICIGGIVTLVNIRSFESCLLISWIIAALLPGILSEHAYPKRLSTFFPALDVLAAITVVQFQRLIAPSSLAKRSFGILCGLALVGYTAFTASAWFAGVQWPYGIPPETKAAQEISTLIGPHTIVIADIGKDYDEGKMTYLLMDTLTDPRNRPNVWYSVHQDVESLDSFITNPLKVILRMKQQPMRWYYLWTRLGKQYQETLMNTQWERVVFFFQERPPGDHPNTAELFKAVEGCSDPIRKRLEASGSFTMAYEVVSCAIVPQK